MNAMLLKALQKAGAMGKKVSKTAYDNAGVISAGVIGAGAGSAYKDGQNQDNLNTMFESFDSVPALTMAEPNIQQWIENGVDEEQARWLGMIDTVYEQQEIISKDEGLQRQFSSILDSLNVNYLDMDLEHHNFKRSKIGLEPLGFVPPDEGIPDGGIAGGSSSKGTVISNYEKIDEGDRYWLKNRTNKLDGHITKTGI